MNDFADQHGARVIKPGAEWQKAGEYSDIRYEVADGIAKITMRSP